VSRDDLEQYLEAAPVPLGLPAGEVERRLGPAARVLASEGHPTGFEYPARGVWIAIEEAAVSSVSFLTGAADTGSARFADALPGGLSVSDAPARVEELYGAPDRVQEIALPRPPRARLVLAFYALRAPATVTFVHRSQAPERLDRIVLSRRAS
jgi:hypothetical protein